MFLERYKKIKRSHIKDPNDLREKQANLYYKSKRNAKENSNEILESQQVYSHVSRATSNVWSKSRKFLLTRFGLDF